MSIIVSASVLGSNLSCLRDEIEKAKAAGVDMIHFDVMDGVFVNNISFGIPVLESIKKSTDMFYDVHLMITEPYRYIDSFVKAGAGIITFHAEASSNILDTIKLIKSYGIKAGLAIKPGTEVSEIEEYITEVDMILVMTVEPGFGGQGFIEKTLDKIALIKRIASEKGAEIDIQVDGGINNRTASLVISNGANNLVSGSYIFSAKDMKAAVESLKVI